MSKPTKSAPPAQAVTARPFNPHEHPLYTSPIRIGQLETRPLDLLEHVQVFGATGSGKTRSFLVPAVRSILAHFGTASGTKAAACVIDAKADMGGFLREATEQAGRLADLRLLTDGGDCWFDLFSQFDANPEAVAEFLYEMVAMGAKTNSTNDLYWDLNSRRLLRAACTLALATHGPRFGGLRGICESLALLTRLNTKGSCDGEDGDDDSGAARDEASRGLDLLRTRLEDGVMRSHISGVTAQRLLDYCRQEIQELPARTWGIISNYARGFLANFADERLTSLFDPHPERERLTSERIIDEGLIVVVSLSPLLYQGLEVPFLRAVKQAVTSRLLMRNQLRNHTANPARLINQERPLVLVMDEFHTTLTPGGASNEAFFLDRAREFRCMCLLATQGVSAIQSRMRDEHTVRHLLNNARTKVFFSNSCPATLNYFETVVGRQSGPVLSQALQRVEVPPRFRLPNHTFAPHNPWRVASAQTQIQREPAMEGGELRDLPTGSAVVVRKSGPPEKVYFGSGPGNLPG